MLTDTDRIGADPRRLLVIDDNPAIHRDIHKLLAPPASSARDLDTMAAKLFGRARQSSPSSAQPWEISNAYQGHEGVELVREALQNGTRYTVAVVDMRMPPGWDGLETIEHLWTVDPNVQIIICTAFSDHAHDTILERLDPEDRLLILKKPFDPIEFVQMVMTMAAKWSLQNTVRDRLSDLSGLVSARTHDLVTANARLRAEIAARKRAEASLLLGQKLEAVGRLASGVAHELNTPLQFLSDNIAFVRDEFCGVMQLLGQVEDAACGSPLEGALQNVDLDYVRQEVSDALDQSLTGIKTMCQIVKALKRLAGAEEEAGVRPIDINCLIEATVEVAAHDLADVASVDIQLSDLPIIDGFGPDLGQALLALLYNAAQACKDAGHSASRPGRIVIETSREEGYVEVSISDDGVGVPGALESRIYEPFFTTREVGKGTGLGLPIARTIATRHGGQLTHCDRQGGGARFTLRLPTVSPLGAGTKQDRTDKDPRARLTAG